jgi:choline-glycine betaine transporter
LTFSGESRVLVSLDGGIAMNASIYIVTWTILAIFVLAMAVYRYRLVRREDATLHMAESLSQASEQVRVYRLANRIERWGKLLTLVVIVYGLTPDRR